ncbi:hypothetical protein C3V43_09240 [Bacteroides heparinolyticus]|nr:hypothetical protein C3V43_09240 [Bacteroides heparinolyticus]
MVSEKQKASKPHEQRSPLITHRSSLIVNRSPLTAHHSPFTAHRLTVKHYYPWLPIELPKEYGRLNSARAA